MVRNSILDLPAIIDSELNLYRKNRNRETYSQLGKILKTDGFRLFKAFSKAIKSQKRFESQLIKKPILTRNINTRLKVLLLGHSYNIYDDFISIWALLEN